VSYTYLGYSTSAREARELEEQERAHEHKIRELALAEAVKKRQKLEESEKLLNGGL